MSDKALIDRSRLSEIAVTSDGVAATNMAAVAAMADVLASSGLAVPPHCRGKADVCRGIVITAMRFGLDPYAVAAKSYVVGDKLAYESQFWHACLTQAGILSRRLRDRYTGEGGARQCEITGWIRGEDEPFVLTSPKFADITPKNSPLWKSNPDLQLYYWTVRNWSRKYCPEVMLGLYTADELEPSGTPTCVTQVTPRTAAELMAARPAPAFVEPTPEPVPEVVEPPVADYTADLQAFEVAVAECETAEQLLAIGKGMAATTKDWAAKDVEWARGHYAARKAQLTGATT